MGGLHGKVGERQKVGTNNCDSCVDVACGATTGRLLLKECGTKSAKRRLVLRSEAAQRQLLNPKPDPEAQPGTLRKNTNFLLSSNMYTCSWLSRLPLGLESKQKQRLSVSGGNRHIVSNSTDWLKPGCSAQQTNKTLIYILRLQLKIIFCSRIICRLFYQQINYYWYIDFVWFYLLKLINELLIKQTQYPSVSPRLARWH